MQFTASSHVTSVEILHLAAQLKLMLHPLPYMQKLIKGVVAWKICRGEVVGTIRLAGWQIDHHQFSPQTPTYQTVAA